MAKEAEDNHTTLEGRSWRDAAEDRNKQKCFDVCYGPHRELNREVQQKLERCLGYKCVGGCMQYLDRCLMPPLRAVQAVGRGSSPRTSLVQPSLVRLTQRRRAKSARSLRQLSPGGGKLCIPGQKAGRAPQPGVQRASPPWSEAKEEAASSQ